MVQLFSINQCRPYRSYLGATPDLRLMIHVAEVDVIADGQMAAESTSVAARKDEQHIAFRNCNKSG